MKCLTCCCACEAEPELSILVLGDGGSGLCMEGEVIVTGVQLAVLHVYTCTGI